MDNWPELSALSQRLKQKKLFLKKKMEYEKQEKLAKAKDHFIEQLLKLDNLITYYLFFISNEIWGEDGVFEVSFRYPEKGFKSATKEDILKLFEGEIEYQLNKETTVLKWSIRRYSDSRCFHIKIYIKDFYPFKLVVEGNKSFGTKRLNEGKIKQLLLKAFKAGPGEIGYSENETEHMEEEHKRFIEYAYKVVYLVPIIFNIIELLLFILSLIIFIKGNFQSAIYVLFICAFISLGNIKNTLVIMKDKSYSVYTH